MPFLCLAQLLLGLLISVPASPGTDSASGIPCPSLTLLRSYSGPLYPLENSFFLPQPEIAASL